MLYPARRISGVPLDRVVLQERAERWTQKPDPDHPGKLKGVLETPKDPVKWPAYIFYFKPVLILLNVIPFGALPDLLRPGARPLRGQRLGLVLRPGRRGVRHVSPAVHPDAEQPHDRRLQRLLRALPVPADLGRAAALRLAVRGGRLLRRLHGGDRAARTGLPGLARPAAAGPVSQADAPLLPPGGDRSRWPPSWRAQYVEFGEFYLPYEAFGSEEYSTRAASGRRRWSWTAFNKHPEPYWVYLFHMTFGHHGIFSLTPIFLFSAWGAIRLLGGRPVPDALDRPDPADDRRPGGILPLRPVGVGTRRAVVSRMSGSSCRSPVLLGLLALLRPSPGCAGWTGRWRRWPG